MDASDHVFEEAEECTSNESGWTMYIASPMHDDDDDENDDGDLSDGEEHEDDDSDDSMLSDASSGPSHLQEPLGKVDDGHGFSTSFNNSKKKDDSDRKFYSYNKPNRQMEKKRGEGKNIKLEKREASELVVNSSTSSVLSGTKVRKISWMGNKGN
ncbi:hypothetical protein AQUCO_00600347v1 [Aquilegia coerulea]|uniref:Uncharacterized protein n=1 Tax=Aquilegia coerulea TaxID=218851 RepID=A0A2G5EPN5_AQUCA|nr:hypothetical protein AQUCO_00600347v1 [Aquilegia coerulea]